MMSVSTIKKIHFENFTTKQKNMKYSGIKTSYNTNQQKNDQKSRKKISSIFWLLVGWSFWDKGG